MFEILKHQLVSYRNSQNLNLTHHVSSLLYRILQPPVDIQHTEKHT